MEPKGSLPQFTSSLRQINPVHAPSSLFLKIHFNIILHLRLGLPNGVFHSGLPYVLHVPPISFFLQHIHSANKIFVHLEALSLQAYGNSLFRQFCSVDSANDNTLNHSLQEDKRTKPGNLRIRQSSVGHLGDVDRETLSHFMLAL